MKCSDDAVVLKRFVEKDRIYTFLAGLNAEFDAVRVQVLEGSAMAVRGASTRTSGNEKTGWTENSRSDNKDSVVCAYCKKPFHTKDKCWKLHGKPANFQPSQNRNWTEKKYHCSMQFMKSAPDLGTENNTNTEVIFDPEIYGGGGAAPDCKNETDLPIAIRKGVRECT
ncbi:hypothetical protein EZV62_024647 [Acer yangbiense]|uniref:Uncharacterized protein n=1 Tax=Acer yangbiense TaxID=1000413 RepID=A0A5C7GWR9_9ROSI|nr:hypothetical protein EZV62_024647 [Acer yangbiense]